MTALLLCFIGLKMGLICGTFVELSCFEIVKMEANLEGSVILINQNVRSVKFDRFGIVSE